MAEHSLVTYDGGSLVIHVPPAMLREWLKQPHVFKGLSLHTDLGPMEIDPKKLDQKSIQPYER